MKKFKTLTKKSRVFDAFKIESSLLNQIGVRLFFI